MYNPLKIKGKIYSWKASMRLDPFYYEIIGALHNSALKARVMIKIIYQKFKLITTP